MANSSLPYFFHVQWSRNRTKVHCIFCRQRPLNSVMVTDDDVNRLVERYVVARRGHLPGDEHPLSMRDRS